MADREELLNTLTGDAPAADTAAETVPPVDDAPAEVVPEQDAQPDAGPSETESFLDSLVEGAPVKKPDDAPPSGEPTPDPAAAETPKTEEAPKPDEPKTLDQEEAEALEGIRSERGRERIKAVFAERRQLEQERAALESDINEFRDMVKSTGATPDEFAQTLEFLKLTHANDEQSGMLALQMLDAQRAELAKRLGVDAPGVDVLADFPDLKAGVEQMMLTREHALEVAKYRRQNQQQQAVQQQQAAQEQEMRAWQQNVANVQQTAVAYFTTREKEADFPAKLSRLQAHFKEPANMQRFLDANPDPKQWFGALQFMYDNIVVAPPARQVASEQPIRARAAHAGAPAASANATTFDQLASIVDRMGI